MMMIARNDEMVRDEDEMDGWKMVLRWRRMEG